MSQEGFNSVGGGYLPCLRPFILFYKSLTKPQVWNGYTHVLMLAAAHHLAYIQQRLPGAALHAILHSKP